MQWSRLRIQVPPHDHLPLDRGRYAGISNAEIRRQVGYEPRKEPVKAKPTSHEPERSSKAFGALPEEKRARAAKMDTVMGLSKKLPMRPHPLRGPLQDPDLPAPAR